MAKITAQMVAELRARTGAGMMDCKKALEEADGDISKAVDILRTKGIAKAEKRAGRAASEGRIVAVIAPDARSGAMIEVNSETDFVSRNDEFGALAQSLAEHVAADASLNANVASAAGTEGMSRPFTADPSKTVEEIVKAASAKTGENVVLRRFARLATDGVVGSYVHFNGKVAVLTEVTGANNDAARELARSVAEHIAAGVPKVPFGVTRDEVPADVVERERAIFVEQARQSGKPDNIVQKMVDGQINKYYAEVTLLDQPWVRDPNSTIKQLVELKSKEAGAPLAIRRFVRYQMGEE
jgi:elongation factor Ts